MLMQTVRDWKIDLVGITDPYKTLRTNQWASDATGKAAIWSCGKLLFQDNIDSTKKGFVRAKLGNVPGVLFGEENSPISLIGWSKMLENALQ